MWTRRYVLTTLAAIAAGCGQGKNDGPIEDRPNADTSVGSAGHREPVPRVVIPGSNLFVPAWAGRRRGEPFHVGDWVGGWKEKYSAVESEYLYALSELSTDVAKHVPKPHRNQQLERARLVERLLKELSPREREEDGQEVPDQSKVRELVSFVKPTMDDLDAVQQRSECLFSIGLQANQELPHLQAARSLGWICQHEIRHYHAAGNFEAVVRSLRRMFRVSTDVRRRGPMVAHVLGMAIDQLASKSILEILQDPSALTADQCERLELLFRSQALAVQGSEVEAARAEYVLWGNSLAGVEQGTLTPEDAGLEQMTEEVARAIDYDLEWAALNELFRFVLEDYLAEPLPSIFERSRYDAKVQELKTTIPEAKAALAKSGKFPKSVLIVLLAPALDQYREALAREQIDLGAVRSLLLVRRFERRRRRLPVGLEETFQDGSAGPVPIDGYSNGPLKFRVFDETVHVYSIAKNGKDDMAEIQWDDVIKGGDFIRSMPQSKP